MYEEKILVAFDCDGVIIRRDYTQKCFEKFNKSKILGKIAYVIVKILTEREIPPILKLLPYLLVLYCLKGTRIDEIENYFSRTIEFYLNPSISKTVKQLKKKGVKVGIISDGIQFFPKYISRIFNLDFVYSNEVEVKNDKLTGKIYKFSKKSEMIERIAEQFSVSYDKIVYVGDDLNLSGKVKCVLFNPKKKSDVRKVDNKNCFLVENLSQLLPLIEKLYRI